MPVERAATLVRLEPEHVWLRLEGRCDQCVGCHGRCDVFRDSLDSRADNNLLMLPRHFIKPSVELQGRLRLVIEESSLRAEAWFAYGVPALGMMLGGVAPALILNATHPWLNGMSLAGAVLGTLFALHISKRYSGRALLAGLHIVEQGSARR